MADEKSEKPTVDDDEVDVDLVDWAQLAWDQVEAAFETTNTQPYARAQVYALLDIGQQLRRLADKHGVDPIS
jgi:hypothetical protein